MLPKVLFLYLFFLCNLTTSKRHLPGLKSVHYNKLEDCQLCRILTDSFKYWLSKTSRGKHEGGDAAWEESKLKTYSRSEMRLVEIQEGLCSELKKYQDHCYMLVEDTELLLEKWWFHEDPDTVDLYTWLCIENLKYCCPSNHFGDMCTPCPLGNTNKVCGGHGLCDGEGTRKGNGTCICHTGYASKYCEECSTNFYLNNTICVPCHLACDGCSSEGASSCEACNKGWILQSGSCNDIDECSTPSTCRTNQYCINTEGSYMCYNCDVSCKSCKGDGSANCTSCEEKYILWSEMCINEEQKYEILLNAIKRLALYTGLFIITMLIFHSKKDFASFIMVTIAMYIYFIEKSYTMSLFEIISNIVYS